MRLITKGQDRLADHLKHQLPPIANLDCYLCRRFWIFTELNYRALNEAEKLRVEIQAMDLKEEAILGEDMYQHWYYVSKGRAIRAFLRDIQPRAILDVGAGAGIFSKILLESTTATRSTCVDTGYTSERQEMWLDKPLQFTRAIEDSQADLRL